MTQSTATKSLSIAALIVALLACWPNDVSAQLLPRRKRTKPCPRAGIPKAQYQVSLESTSVSAVSLPAILVDRLEEDVEEQLELARGIDVTLSERSLLLDQEEVRNAITDVRESLRQGASQASVIGREAMLRNSLEQLSGVEASLRARAISNPPGVLDSDTSLADLRSVELELRRQLPGGLANITATAGSSLINQANQRLSDVDRNLLGLPDRISDLRTGLRGNGTIQNDPLSRVRTKLLQFSTPLAVDHCQISQIAVEVESTGRWTLKLLAEQNQDSAAAGIPTAHLRQNEFVIQLRFFGEFKEELQSSTMLLGRPALAQVDSIEFYVRNGQPYHLFVSRPDNLATDGLQRAARTNTRLIPRVEDRNVSLLLRRYFDRIDRAEVSFHYRGGDTLIPVSRSALTLP